MMPSTVATLHEITFATVRDIIGLDAGDVGRNFVASNAVSLAEAQFNPGSWFRAIYADDTPVGFLMLLDPAVPRAMSRGPLSPGDVFLWRLMIDHRFQGRGFGRQALDLVRDRIGTLPHAKRWVTSYVPEPGGPEGFYLRYGFEKTGQLRANGSEVELICTLPARK